MPLCCWALVKYRKEGLNPGNKNDLFLIIIAIFVIIYIPLWMSMCIQQKQYPVGIEFEPYVFRSG
jgi:hypothetical protein